MLQGQHRPVLRVDQIREMRRRRRLAVLGGEMSVGMLAAEQLPAGLPRDIGRRPIGELVRDDARRQRQIGVFGKRPGTRQPRGGTMHALASRRPLQRQREVGVDDVAVVVLRIGGGGMCQRHAHEPEPMRIDEQARHRNARVRRALAIPADLRQPLQIRLDVPVHRARGLNGERLQRGAAARGELEQEHDRPGVVVGVMRRGIDRVGPSPEAQGVALRIPLPQMAALRQIVEEVLGHLAQRGPIQGIGCEVEKPSRLKTAIGPAVLHRDDALADAAVAGE